jgi:hypothetical protein
MNGDTPTHAFPLAAVRRGVFLALCGVLATVSGIALVLIAQAWLVQLRYCDPSTRPPVSQTLLGQVPGQRFIGSVWIHFAASDQLPASFSYTSDSAGGPASVLKPALAALQDTTPARPMQPLPYASLGLFSTRAGEQCLRPDPALRGYIVAEVWDDQVNLGYGGAGIELRDQASRVLASELERIR